jgi:hypothetical protein
LGTEATFARSMRLASRGLVTSPPTSYEHARTICAANVGSAAEKQARRKYNSVWASKRDLLLNDLSVLGVLLRTLGVFGSLLVLKIGKNKRHRDSELIDRHIGGTFVLIVYNDCIYWLHTLIFANCEWPANERMNCGRKWKAALRSDGLATQGHRQGTAPTNIADWRKSIVLELPIISQQTFGARARFFAIGERAPRVCEQARCMQ